MTGPLLPGFDRFEVEVPGATLRGRRAGSGPVVLLLHGYPQTGAMWHHLAPALAASHTVVVPDLRGYGASTRHDEGEALTFRAMAADQPALLGALGLDTSAGVHVVGHDRGARTAHRLALDHPDLVASLALLDILPTLTVWEQMDAWLARRYFHWTFLAQGGGMPERLLLGDPQAWLDHQLGALGGTDGMHPAALEEYAAAGRRPEVVRAWCADYRAGAREDLEHDRADLAGRADLADRADRADRADWAAHADRARDLATMVLWGERGVVGARLDPVGAWRAWFPAATGHAVDAGHFLAEERPAEVLAAVQQHLAGLEGPGTLGP